MAREKGFEFWHIPHSNKVHNYVCLNLIWTHEPECSDELAIYARWTVGPLIVEVVGAFCSIHINPLLWIIFRNSIKYFVQVAFKITLVRWIDICVSKLNRIFEWFCLKRLAVQKSYISWHYRNGVVIIQWLTFLCTALAPNEHTSQCPIFYIKR